MTDSDHIYTVSQHYCSVCREIDQLREELASRQRDLYSQPPARPLRAEECPIGSVIAGQAIALIKARGPAGEVWNTTDPWSKTNPSGDAMDNNEAQDAINSGAKILRVGR